MTLRVSLSNIAHTNLHYKPCTCMQSEMQQAGSCSSNACNVYILIHFGLGNGFDPGLLGQCMAWWHKNDLKFHPPNRSEIAGD